MANREIFGESDEDEELEIAYQIEKLRELGTGKGEDLSLFALLNGTEVSGLVDQKEYLIVAPMGRSPAGKIAEVKLAYIGSKPEKISVSGGDVLVHEIDPTRSVKIEVILGSNLKISGKSKASWSGAGKKLLIFDSRGRPLPEILPSEKQREQVKKLKEYDGKY